jgi:ABC-2 type transport system permease protein
MYLVFVVLLFRKPGALPGYTASDLTVLLGFYVLFNSGLFFLGKDLFVFNELLLNGGYLEIILTKPLDPLMHIILRGCNFNELPNVLLALAIIVTGGVFGGYELSFSKAFLLFLSTLGGFSFCGAILIVLATISFYVPARSNLNFIYGNVLEFVKYPVTIYPLCVQKLFTWVLPLICSGYCQLAILKGDEFMVRIAPVLTLICFGLLMLAVRFFYRSLKLYVSSGS